MSTWHIEHVCDAPESIAALARLFKAEWEPWYGAEGPGDAEADLLEAVDRVQLPLRLVALGSDGAVLGSIALRKEGLTEPAELGGLVVAPEHRRQGIGEALVMRMLEVARKLGIGRIPTSTEVEWSLIERMGWEPIGSMETLRGTVPTLALDLDGGE